MQRPRKEHYVPQFYLKSFTYDDKQEKIYCYDKNNRKSYSTSISNIACERDFYNTTQTDQLEKKLQQLESRISPIYYHILNEENMVFLSDTEKRIFSIYISIQIQRTKDKRMELKQLVELFNIVSKNCIDSLRKELDQCDDEKIIEAQFSPGDIIDNAMIIENMKWCLQINGTKIPFWSSDNPITRTNNFIKRGPRLGLLIPGLELHFPLSPNFTLLMLNVPSTYSANIILPFYYMDDTEEVVYENHLQVINSTRHVFSNKNEFSLIETILTDHPELGYANRRRIIQTN